jgi:hypothetical protein
MSAFGSFHTAVSSARFIRIFFVIFVLFFAAFRMLTPEFETITGGLRIPDVAIISHGNDLYSLFQSYGEEGRSYYTYIQALDAVYPLSYGIFFLSLLYFYIRKLFKENSTAGYAILIPYLAVFSDYGENICIFILNRIFPAKFGYIGDIALFFSSMKWIFFILSVLLILLGTIVFFIRKARGKDK